MVYLLFYDEVTNFDKSYAWMDKWQAVYGMQPVTIKREGTLSKSLKSFRTIKEAVNDPDLSKLKWVWMCPGVDAEYLDEFDHPEDNVVYCIGSDYDGFDNLPVDELPGVKIKLRQPVGHTGEWFAAMVIPLVVYDRFLKLNDRRL